MEFTNTIAACKKSHRCSACRYMIKQGTKHALDFETGHWIHVRCLVRLLKFRALFTHNA